MKFFICFALIVAVASYAAAGPAGVGGSSSGGASAIANQEAESEIQQGAQPSSAVDLARLRKSAYGGGSSGSGYGGASIPAPPCPKNYLFSCQPNLSPVACSAPAPSYGSIGAYSAPVPAYVAPLPRNLGVGVPQPIGYSNQYYQY